MADFVWRGRVDGNGEQSENNSEHAKRRKGRSGIRPAIPKVEYFNITDIIFIIAAPIHPGTTGPTSASTSTNCYLEKKGINKRQE